MNHTKSAVMIAIFKVLVKGKKHYCQMSVDTLLELLVKWHNISVNRRWLFQCLHDLEASGYITRKQRYRRRSGNLSVQIPSLISITLDGARELYRRGVDAARGLIDEILSWLRGNDKRWPEPAPPGNDQLDSRIFIGPTPLKELMPGVLFDLKNA
jgi:hypothetical protein